MNDEIHDAEFDTSERTVRALLAVQCPQWADGELTSLRSSGTTNALWRVSDTNGDVVVRLPRTPGAVGSVEMECELLPALADTWPSTDVAVPRLVHHGEPNEAFDHPWAVLEWLEGEDGWNARDELANDQGDRAARLAVDLAESVRMIGSLTDLPIPDRRDGDRGGPFRSLLTALDDWLDDPQWSAPDHLDVKAIRRLASQALEVADEPVEIGVVHGDLLPGNIVTKHGQLSAIIDWGGAGVGDIAQDLTPAWAIFDGEARAIFRSELQVDDAAWIRARTFELEHAIGGILYYGPKGHELAEVMTRTLGRILAE